MTFKEDITKRISSDFGEGADEAKRMLVDAFKNNNDLKLERIIRCIVFLAKGDLTDLRNYIESANVDTRDVILWAEYEGIGKNKKPRCIRDFNKSFNKSFNDSSNA